MEALVDIPTACLIDMESASVGISVLDTEIRLSSIRISMDVPTSYIARYTCQYRCSY